MKKVKILWTDDEIDVLKPHILFLEEKGFLVMTANSGDDAISKVKIDNFDIIFLDEHMPGLSGLETLEIIKGLTPSTPVIMITKSEEEDIMDEAIGSKIADYLIKPVNPKQILLSIKKNLQLKELVSRKTTASYQTQFGELGNLINRAMTFDDWVEIYKALVYWELELEVSNQGGMKEVLKMQSIEANSEFSKYIKNNYKRWFQPSVSETPRLSQNLFKESVFPFIKEGRQVVFIVVDNLRLDQLQALYPYLSEYFTVEKEELYCSILPTATQYARNAIFAGLMPMEIKKHFPDLWKEEDEEGSKNMHEEELLRLQLKRLGKEIPMKYVKISNLSAGKKLVENARDILNYPLSVLVYNFVDILSHARTEMEMIKELASDESAYRSLTLSWFLHSTLYDLLKELSGKDITLVLTTDHGSIRVQQPVKVVGDRMTTTNLRYKMGKNLNYDAREVFEINNPSEIHLPQANVSSKYIFADTQNFFAYPNRFNHYVGYYKNTFQHGGISMEEMMVPLLTLGPR